MKSTNNLEIVEKLKNLGLSEREARVYLVLNKFDKVGIGKLALETGLPRQSLYYYLDSLKERKLADEIIYRGRRMFFAKDVENLRFGLSDKMNMLDFVGRQLMEGKISSTKGLGIYEGKKEIQRLFVEHMKRQDSKSRLLATETNLLGYFVNELMGDKYKLYEAVRVNRKVKMNVLVVVEGLMGGGDIKDKFSDDERPYIELRVKDQAPKGSFGVYAWHDRVWFLIKGDSGRPKLLELFDPKMVEIFWFYFHFMWDQAEVMYKSQN